MSPWLFNLYMEAVMRELKMGMEWRGVKFQEEGREGRLPGLLYLNNWDVFWANQPQIRENLVGRWRVG